MHDVIVVGAGTAGCFTSYQLAKKGLDVTLIEKEPGLKDRIVCTGIISKEACTRFSIPSEAIIKDIDSFKIFASSGVYFHYKHSEPFASIIDREYFQTLLLWKAHEAGVKFMPGSQVLGIERGPETVKALVKTKHGVGDIIAKMMVIATGIDLSLLEKAGLSCSPEFLQGVQMEAEVDGIDETEIYLGEEIAPKSFAWSVPLGNGFAKIGLTARRQSTTHLVRFLQNPLLKGKLQKRCTKTGFRFIPYGLAGKSASDRIIAVGDAAGQVKTTTGGGIYYGLLCSEIAVETILEAFEQNDLSEKKLRKYERKWQKILKPEIETGLFMRKLFSSLDDKRIDLAINLANSDGIKPFIMKRAKFDWQKDFLSSLIKRPILQKLF